jgi:hypothetical protein
MSTRRFIATVLGVVALAPQLGAAQATLTVLRAAGPVNLADDLSEFASAEPLNIVSGSATGTFRLLWDDANLYVSAQVSDPDLRFSGIGRDGPIYDADGVEVMLDAHRDRVTPPDADDRHIIVSARGDVFDASAFDVTAFDIAGFAPGVKTSGTFNDPLADTGYQVVMAIPWSAIPLNPGETPAIGLQLVADLALNDLGTTGLTVSVSYSNDGGATFTYTPTSGGGGAPSGYDRNVTHIRWSFIGNLSQTPPNNTGNVGFTVRIR